MAYSLDLRERVIAHVEDGNTQLSASELFGINDKTVRKWIELKAETGSLVPRAFAGGAKPRVSKEELYAHVEAHPDATLEERGKHFDMTIAGIAYHLHKHGYVQKKFKIRGT